MVLRACPNCCGSNPDWQSQLRALQPDAGTQQAPRLS
jgi:hypothetical protein